MSDWVTEDDLARARRDPEFRQQFLARNLDRLLAALNRLRREGPPTAQGAQQLRDGADLAVKLADRLQNDANPQPV